MARPTRILYEVGYEITRQGKQVKKGRISLVAGEDGESVSLDHQKR